MNAISREDIADAWLFEGYILYPYRPSSIKNQQRWTFGGLFPRAIRATRLRSCKPRFCCKPG